MNSKLIGLTALVSALSMANISYADVPNTFASGEPAVAGEINENFTDLDGRVTALEGTVTNSTATTISVDCTSESINSAVAAAAPASHLIVNITGDCQERVLITRSGVSLVGIGADAASSITYAETPLSSFHASLNADELGELNGAVNVIGAQNVIIDNLTIQGSVIESGKGVSVLYNGAALIQNSTITGNTSGIVSNSGGVAVLSSNNITANDKYGVVASDGATIRLTGDNTINQSTANSRAAVGVYRNGTVTFVGENTVTSSALALEIYDGSQLRAYYGLLTVNGNSTVAYESQINFRDVNHTGNINVRPKASLRMFNSTEQTTTGVNVTGNITLWALTNVIQTTNTTVTGDVNCLTNTSYFLNVGTLVGTSTGCDTVL
jgi:hypothetical protein